MLASGLDVYRFVRVGQYAGNSISLSASPRHRSGGEKSSVKQVFAILILLF